MNLKDLHPKGICGEDDLVLSIWHAHSVKSKHATPGLGQLGLSGRGDVDPVCDQRISM